VTSISDSSIRRANQASRHTTAILAVILISYFMILLDNSIIFTAVPKIQAAMHLAVSAGSGRELTSAAAVLAAHVDAALSAGTVLLAACLATVIGLILPAHRRSRRPSQTAPRYAHHVVPEQGKAMTNA
jgi:hypothetical protein